MLTFTRQVLRNYKQTGAVAPSSARLARMMTSRLGGGRGRRILEVGAGTGAVTRYILPALRETDELVVIELNPVFCRRLESELLGPFRAAHPGIAVTLHCLPAEQFHDEAPYDDIICSLPFNNFPVGFMRSVFRKLLGMLTADGQLVYYEYLGIRTIKAPLVGSGGRRSLRRRQAVTRVIDRRHAAERRVVLRNLPPAVFVRLRSNGSSPRGPVGQEVAAEREPVTSS